MWDVCLDTNCRIMIAWMWVKSLSYEGPPYCYLFALRKERRDSGGEGGVAGVLMMKSKITEITPKILQMVIKTSPSADFYRELDLSDLTSTPPPPPPPPPPPSRLIFNLPTKTCWAVAWQGYSWRWAPAQLREGFNLIKSNNTLVWIYPPQLW